MDLETIFRVQSSVDMWLRLFGIMTAEEFKQFLEGSTNINVIADREFARRFPKEYAVFEKEFYRD